MYAPKNTSIKAPKISHIDFGPDSIIISYQDGRVLHAPLVWYPLLHRATDAQRRNYTLCMEGEGVSWEDIDEDILAKSFLAGLMLADREPFCFLTDSDRPQDQVYVERNRARARAKASQKDSDKPKT